MASVFPGTLDNFATNKVNATATVNDHAAHHDDLADATNKIEIALGTNPFGSAATVGARFVAAEAATTALTTRVTALETPTINAQTGTTYTLVLTDAGKIVGMTNASANTLTIPTNASVAFAIGSQVMIRQGGAGQTTAAAAGGVTLQSRGAAFKIAGQYGYATLVKVATDTWELTGDITT